MGVAASGLNKSDGQVLENAVIKDADINKAKELISQNQNVTSKLLSLKERGVQAQENSAPSEIKIQIRNFILKFIEKSIPYVVFFLSLMCVYLALTGAFNSTSSAKKSNSVEEMKKYEQMIKNRFSSFFGSIYLYFYSIWESLTLPSQVKMVMNTFSQYKDGGPTEPRSLIESGRCDNIKWIETTGDGQMGTCTSAIRPKDLTWKLKTSANPEFMEGSAFSTYLKDNNITPTQWLNNTDVIIQWDRSPETTFFVPQCEQSYFAKQCRTEINSGACAPNEQWSNGYCCVKTNLLKEQGLTCGLVSFNKGSVAKRQDLPNDTKTNPEFSYIDKKNKNKIPEKTGLQPTFYDIVSTSASSQAAAFIK